MNMPAPFDNEKLYAELRMKALNCQTKDAFTKTKAGGWRYDIVGMGMKANMADVNAAIGLAQIRQYDKLLIERKRVFNTYDRAFKDEPWCILPPSKDDKRETSYHLPSSIIWAIVLRTIRKPMKTIITRFLFPVIRN